MRSKTYEVNKVLQTLFISYISPAAKYNPPPQFANWGTSFQKEAYGAQTKVRGGSPHAAQPAHEAGHDYDSADSVPDDGGGGLPHQLGDRLLSGGLLQPDGRRLSGPPALPRPDHPLRRGGERGGAAVRGGGRLRRRAGGGQPQPEAVHSGQQRGAPGLPRRGDGPAGVHGKSHLRPDHRPGDRRGGGRQQSGPGLHGRGRPRPPGRGGLCDLHSGQQDHRQRPHRPDAGAHHRGADLRPGNLHSAVLPAVQNHGHPHSEPH